MRVIGNTCSLLLLVGILSSGCRRSEPVEETKKVDKPLPTRVVVRILDYPKVPDLSSNPYPNAYATARVLPVETTGTAIAKNEPIIAMFRVLGDRRRMAAADFSPSDVLGVTLIPSAEASQSTKSVQVLETYTDPELPSYYVRTPTYLAGASSFAKEDDQEIKEVERSELPVIASDSGPRKARLAANPEKQARIAAALSRIEEHLQREGEGSWDTWQDSLAGFRSDLYATSHHDSHIDHRVRKSMELESYDVPVENGIPAMDAVRQLADKVEAAGINFVLYSVPSRIEIYPEWFSRESGISDRHVGPTRLHYLKQLLEAGVEVIDAGEILREAKIQRGHRRLFWQGPEFHVSPQGYEVMAPPLASYIREHGGLTEADYFSPDLLTAFEEEVAIHHTREFRMPARRILIEPNRSPIDPNPESPVFFLGDSNLFWWQTNLVANCGLLGQLAYELNHFVDWQGRANLRPHYVSELEPMRVANKKLWIQLQTAWVLWDQGAPHQNVEPFLDTLPDVAGMSDRYQPPVFESAMNLAPE